VAAARMQFDQSGLLGCHQQFADMGAGDTEAVADFGVGHGRMRIVRARHRGLEQCRDDRRTGRMIEEQHGFGE
jgi:hypothetical protein